MRSRNLLIILFLSAFQNLKPAFAQTVEFVKQPVEVIRPFVGYSIYYDDNVFGLPKGVSPVAQYQVEERSDFSRTLSAGIALDKLIGRQNVTANARFDNTTYDTLKTLNFNGYNLEGNWGWVLGSDLVGNVGSARSRGRSISSDFRQVANSTVSQSNEHVDAAWRFHSNFRTRLALSKSRTEYGLAFQKFANRDETIAELGGDYLARSGSSVGLKMRYVEGNFPHAIQTPNGEFFNNFSQVESKVHVDWLATGKTRLQVLAGPVSRNQKDSRIPDFTGFNARAIADYKATGALSITSQLWRETAVVDDFSVAYSLNRGFSLESRWQISAKTTLKVSYQAEQRDFSQQTSALRVANGPIMDTLRNTTFRLIFLASRALEVNTVVFHAVRSSDSYLANYTRNGVAINIRGEF